MVHQKNDVMLIKNSRWIPCDSHETVLASDSLSLLNSSMVRIKVTSRKGREEHCQKVQTWAQVQVQLAPPALVDPPAPVLETPPIKRKG